VNISANFRKKFETVPMGYSWAGGKLIHEKTRRKNLVTLSLKVGQAGVRQSSSF
jgi:hypothetical protein